MVEPEDTCRSCGAPILWVETDSGTRIPFDAEETKVLYRKHVGTRHLDYAEGSGSEEIYEKHLLDGHISHFVTCPDAEDWSGSSRSEQRDMKLEENQEADHEQERG